MNRDKDYKEINRAAWNSKTPSHISSAFYDVKGFLEGNTSLKEIELGLLGDIEGKKVLHLQCHFGQDSISLARMGADVTAADLSDVAISEALKLSRKAGTHVRFICSDVYGLPDLLDEKFDIVFASYGAIPWLPDLDTWANVAGGFLKVDGRLVLVEFHPVVWMFDNDFEKISYSYFNTGAIMETEEGTYADRAAPIRYETVSWNHGIAEVLSALIGNDMRITSFDEFDYSPYDCFKGMSQGEPGRYRIDKVAGMLPMVYAVTAAKRG